MPPMPKIIFPSRLRRVLTDGLKTLDRKCLGRAKKKNNFKREVDNRSPKEEHGINRTGHKDQRESNGVKHGVQRIGRMADSGKR